MSRPSQELDQAARELDAETEAMEREAARRRLRPELELAMITSRMEAAELRREMRR